MDKPPSLLIRIGERSKRYQILDPEVTIGPGDEDGLRLKAKGMVPGQLTITLEDGNYSIRNTGASEFKLWISGRQLEDHVLMDGDVIEIGKMKVEFHWQGAIPEDKISTSVSRNKRIAKARKTRQGRRASNPNLKLISLLLVGALAIGIPFVIWLQDAEFGTSAQQLITLAEERLELARFDESEALLARAERSDPTSEDLMAVENIRKRIAAARSLNDDRPVLARAARSFTVIQRFESQYLLKSPDRREACREFMKEIAEWNQEYREVCTRHRDKPQYLDILNQIKGLENKYRSAAELSDPDNETDVLFAAGRRVRLRLRRYPEAVAILETWLEKNMEAGSRLGSEARKRVNEYHGDCLKWVAEKVEESRLLAERGYVDDAIAMMQTIVDECALADSLPAAKRQLTDLKGRAK